MKTLPTPIIMAMMAIVDIRIIIESNPKPFLFLNTKSIDDVLLKRLDLISHFFYMACSKFHPVIEFSIMGWN